jgi:hypothetical protein
MRCPIINYALIAGIAPVHNNIAGNLNKLWCLHFLSSDVKTFFFKLHHNILGLNSRVHHINNDRDPSCTFCVKAKNLPAERESFAHFFWDCPSSNFVICKFFSMYFRENVRVTKNIFFTGIMNEENSTLSLPVLLICSLLKYILWIFKLRKKLPSWPSFNSEFFYYFNVLIESSRKFKVAVSTCDWLKHQRD